MSTVDAKGEPKAYMEIRVKRKGSDVWEDPIKVPAAIEDNGDPATLGERLKRMLGLAPKEK